MLLNKEEDRSPLHSPLNCVAKLPSMSLQKLALFEKNEKKTKPRAYVAIDKTASNLNNIKLQRDHRVGKDNIKIGLSVCLLPGHRTSAQS